MIQQILIGIIFFAALFYIANRLYKNFTAKDSDCGGNCGCSKIDLKKIEKEMLSKKSD
jgi:hypothetical protein